MFSPLSVPPVFRALALIMSTLVFTQIGIPLEVVALIAGVDRVLDMIRTSINVVGDSTTALAVSRMEGELGSNPSTKKKWK